MRFLLSRVWLCAFVWVQALGGDAPRESGSTFVPTITYPGLDQAASCTDPVVAAQWLVRNSQGKSLSEYTGLCNTFIKACISYDNLPVADYWLRRAEKAGVRCDRQTYERLAAALERDGQHNKATAWAEKYNHLTGQSIGGFERMIPSEKKEPAKPAAPSQGKKKAAATKAAATKKTEKKVVNAAKKATPAAQTKAPAKPSTAPPAVMQTVQKVVEKVIPKSAPPAPPAPKVVKPPVAAAVQEKPKVVAPNPVRPAAVEKPQAAAPKQRRTFRFALPKLFRGLRKQQQHKKKRRFNFQLPKVSFRRPSIPTIPTIPSHVRGPLVATAGTFGATIVARTLLGMLSSHFERQSSSSSSTSSVGKLARPLDFRGLDDIRAHSNPVRTMEEESSVVQRRLQEEIQQVRKAAFGQ